MSHCPASSVTPHTILVVDDQEANVQLVCGFLMNPLYAIHLAVQTLRNNPDPSPAFQSRVINHNFIPLIDPWTF